MMQTSNARPAADPEGNALANQRLVGWLVLCAGGNEAALKQVYDATSAHLLGVAFDILHHRGRAEEVLQEAYLRVWQHAARYDPALARPMTWLINIVRNGAIDVLRAQRAERAMTVPLDAEHEDRVVDFAPRPEQLLQRALAARHIEQGLDELSRTQRQAVAMVIYRGLTIAEIASHSGVPLGTAKAWVRRGLQQLQARLDGCTRPAPVDWRGDRRAGGT